jgi:hypothetical protein
VSNSNAPTHIPLRAITKEPSCRIRTRGTLSLLRVVCTATHTDTVAFCGVASTCHWKCGGGSEAVDGRRSYLWVASVHTHHPKTNMNDPDHIEKPGPAQLALRTAPIRNRATRTSDKIRSMGMETKGECVTRTLETTRDTICGEMYVAYCSFYDGAATHALLSFSFWSND